MSIELAATREEEEMSNQRTDGVGGNLIGHGRESVVGRGIGSEMLLPLNKLNDSSKMRDAGKIASDVKKTKSETWGGQKKRVMRQALLLL